MNQQKAQEEYKTAPGPVREGTMNEEADFDYTFRSPIMSTIDNQNKA